MSPTRPANVRRRARDLGIPFGRYRPGKHNAITDVEGILVGHSTIIRGEGALVPGEGPVRTGVTAILPNGGNIFMDRLVGGGFVLNGAGEVSGLTQVQEWGLIETPILLTNTMSVGAVSDAVARQMVERYPGIGDEHDVIIPIVGECDDSWLNDVAGRHVKDEHVEEAIRTAASGPVAEGAVGGGTGMITCDFKAGIGTASRKLPEVLGGYTLGVLVMSNFGKMHNLRIAGLPLGEVLAERYANLARREHSYGSIIAVLATDAPLQTNQLNRLCKRVALGIGRVGSYAAHGSGEIVVGFSTANVIPRRTRKMVYRAKILLDQRLDPLYEAVMDATEEAILNSMCMAHEMDGVNGNFVPALPLEEVRAAMDALKPLLTPAKKRPSHRVQGAPQAGTAPGQSPGAEDPGILTASRARPTDMLGGAYYTRPVVEPKPAEAPQDRPEATDAPEGSPPAGKSGT